MDLCIDYDLWGLENGGQRTRRDEKTKGEPGSATRSAGESALGFGRGKVSALMLRFFQVV